MHKQQTVNGANGLGRRRFSDDELLDAALEVFHERGFHAAGTDEIAARAGTTRPTLHTRLGNKDDIYRRVLERETAMIREALVAAYVDAADDRLRPLVRKTTLPLFEHARKRPAGLELLIRSEPSGLGPEALDGLLDSVISALAQLGRVQAQRKGRGSLPEDADLLIAAAAAGAVRQICEYALRHQLDLDVAERLAVAFVENAVRPLTPGAFAVRFGG